MEKEDIQKLFQKYSEGKCTQEEKALLESWYLEFNEHEPDISPGKVKAVERRIFRELPGNHMVFMDVALKLIAAVVLIGIVTAISLRFFFSQPHSGKVPGGQDIGPGSNIAVLTLSNGKKVNLNSAHAGRLYDSLGIAISKTAAGQISYQDADKDESGNSVNRVETNNIATPVGGQWKVVLPDGSAVWLNSASSLSYPASFAGQKQRVVQLTGEGYFEVAKDKLHPFIVQSGTQSVEVLGTHFNISTYRDEPVAKTTLAEGRVKVSLAGGLPQYLAPGQQAILQNGVLHVDSADVEEALAWKNGYFRFNDEPIQSVMRKLSRWYNIDVAYDPGITADGMNGKISRYKDISQVLAALEATRTVHFKVEGRRVTVMR